MRYRYVVVNPHEHRPESGAFTCSAHIASFPGIVERSRLQTSQRPTTPWNGVAQVRGIR